MKKCKIYFTSDMHGYFYPTTYGDMEIKPLGLMQCAPHFEKDGDTLVIDGGDNLQGSAFAYYCRNILNSNDTIAEIMNDAGYDYYTLGNHDFNYGQEYQQNYIDKMNAKCVCQNVMDAKGNCRFPYDICILKNGLRVGLVGIVTDFINVWEKKENLVGVQVIDPFIEAKKALEELEGKTDINICIYHGGFECDLETGEFTGRTTENVGYKIAKELNFDVLLTGHQHMSIDGRDLFGTYIVQPYDKAKEYHFVEISLDNGTKTVTSKKLPADTSVGDEFRKKYQVMEDKIQVWLNESAGHLSRELLPEDKIQMALKGSPIADFLNKVMFWASGAQLSVTSLANEITGFKKDVSTRDIIATYPFPNTLVVVKMTGKQLKAAMERTAEYFSLDENGQVVVSKSFLEPKVEHFNYDYYAGVDYKMNPEKPMGERVTDLTYNGRPVLPEDEFEVCVNNYRFSGAGGYPMYTQCPVVREINTEMVDLIMDYFANHDYVEV